jgi:septal ring factor EnvC (AmiA/AmiB activator)
MKHFKIILVWLVIFAPLSFAASDPVLDEIKANLNETKKKIEEGKNQISILEENEKKLQSNIESLDKSLAKKQSELNEVKGNLDDYSQKLNAASQAKRDFNQSAEKDKIELGLVEKDIVAVKKKLIALEAAKKALQESIEIAEENLSKMDDRSGTWQKNKSKVETEITDLDKDFDLLDKKKAEQEKLLTENTAALSKWRKTIQNQEAGLQKIEQKYQSAIREAERKVQQQK